MLKNTSFQSIKNNFKGKDIVSLDQFDSSSIQTVFKTAKEFIKRIDQEKALDILRGTIATLIFYEPSSRTFSSFSSAVKRLGGQTIEYQNPLQTSSAVKGETIEDTMHMFESYSDLIVMRHPEIAAVIRAAEAATLVPVINAGNGTGEHPTQALLDMFTMYQKFGSLDNLKGLMAGDLLNGRTVHSLMNGLSNYKNIELYLLSPKNLRFPQDLLKEFQKRGVKVTEIYDDADIPDDCNFWYWTRVQKERFANIDEYEKLKHSFILTPELVKRKATKDTIFMHPLPRVGEIDTGVDSDPRALYLTVQPKNGVYVRMALVSLVLGKV